ncbi:putative glutamine amidotransferase [Alkalispirochaeta americana]|uniref:Putative glutamine amidotransferase n=1 Tax=Alkalispirochaeta americana TaxID=159291 RepID=A0A1N6QEN5_9SPIO|nr:gamma-glutamyl-gamma-aminobutyrate hydrolase family protein [Alkalispirochaeta americana]SIQ14998.1 putative glutamine amidotransferase [Alkalispirochaeta americana]
MRPVIGITNTNRTGFIDGYAQAVADAGGSPLIIPVVKELPSLRPVLTAMHGLILSGGADINPSFYNEPPRQGLEETLPGRDSHELALVDYVLNRSSIPVLGICRGMQMLNVHGGGTCYQDLEREREEPGTLKHMLFGIYPFDAPAHRVRFLPGSRLEGILQTGEIEVNSFHHQAIRELSPTFRATAHAPDGVIEAIESPGERFIAGVQWHPEMMAEKDKPSQHLFQAFLRECGRKNHH